MSWCCRRLWDRSCTWDRTRTRKVTQQQLENMYLGPELFLDERYAQVYMCTALFADLRLMLCLLRPQMLAALFFSLTYSTGLPVLIPLAGLFFFTLYWVDKWLFCNLYRSPPQCVVELSSLEPQGYRFTRHCVCVCGVTGIAGIWQNEPVYFCLWWLCFIFRLAPGCSVTRTSFLQ
jgi:hypothetical protein